LSAASPAAGAGTRPIVPAEPLAPTNGATAIVPVASGKVIVLSAVGSTTLNVVSNASAVDPSNIIDSVISMLVELSVVVVPFTIKSPEIVTAPVEFILIRSVPAVQKSKLSLSVVASAVM
jgi:hypothetical protein